MFFSYSGDPQKNDKDAVRFLVGDTDPEDILVFDAEIDFTLVQQPNITLAAALVCESLSAKFARQVDKKIGSLSISASQKSKHYRERAQELRALASRTALPVFGGQSIDTNNDLIRDTDAVQPYFSIGQDDHPELPRAPNEPREDLN